MKAVVWCVICVVGMSSNLFAQNEIEKINNKDGQFTLIKNDTINDSGIPVLKYKVLRNADKRIVVEGSVTMGMLEWTADYELTESRSLGSAQSKENQQSRKIDVRPYILKN